MLRLALHLLRHRRASLVATVVALLAAAALVAGCGLLLQTGLSGHVAPERYAAAPVVVSGDQSAYAVTHKKGKAKTKSKPLAERVWIPERLVGRVRDLPAARVVRDELDFPAYLVVHGRPVPGPHGAPSWGHAWASAGLTPFLFRAGRPPTAATEIVVDAALARRAGVHVGSRVDVQSTRGPGNYRVVGVAAPASGPAGLASQSTVFFAADKARALAGHQGEVAALGVWPTHGTTAAALASSIRRALSGGPFTVSSGAGRGSAEFPQAADAKVVLVSLGGAVTASSLLVAMLVVVGTVGLTIQRRYREFALLRTVGATPKQIRSMVSRELLVLGAVASVPGAVAGLAVARWLRDRLVAVDAVPSDLHLVRGPIPLLLATALTMASAWLAARIASRRAARVRPTAALAEAAAPPARLSLGHTVVGAVMVAGAAALVVVLRDLHTEPAAAPVTLLTSLIWVTGLTLLAPPVLRVGGAAVSFILRGNGHGAGYLAAANLRTGARRYASVGIPVLLVVTMACTIVFTHTSLAHAAQQQVRRAVRADYVVRSSGPGLPAAATEALRRTPGVDTVTRVVRSVARGADLAKYSVQGVTPAGIQHTMKLGVRTGSIGALRDGSAAMTTTAADRAGVRVGGNLHLFLGDGTPVTVTLVAIYARGLGFPDLTMPHDVIAAHVDDPLDSVALVHGRPGLRKPLDQAVHGYAGATTVATDAGPEPPSISEQGADTSVQYLVLILIVGFSAIAGVNTMLMSTADRRGEFATLRLLGTTRTQVRRMVRCEASLLVVICGALGTVLSLSTITAFSIGVTGSMPYIPTLPYVAILGGTAVLVLGTTEVAVRAFPDLWLHQN